MLLRVIAGDDLATSILDGVQLDVDLGTFGAASGTALIEGNAISQAAITYTSPPDGWNRSSDGSWAIRNGTSLTSELVGIDSSVQKVTCAMAAAADALLIENRVLAPPGLPRSTSK